MNNKPRFFITDVFGERKYSGNQLATFIDCANLSDKEMQIAREINFSETTLNRYYKYNKIDIQTGQGYEINRPSTLFLRAEEKDGHINILVGGQVFPIAEGVWN